MSDAVLVSLITTTVPALIGVIILVINNRQSILLAKIEATQVKTEAAVAAQAVAIDETKLEVTATKEAVADVALHTNSMKDALIKVTGEAEFAKGLKEGQEESTVTAGTPPATVTVPKQKIKVEPPK